MSRAVLSIGSNIGDSLGYLRGAVAALAEWIVATSGVYETPAWGGVEQQNFLNAVVIVDDSRADAQEWLRRAQDCERAADRSREVHWGPRTLDVDVIAVDEVRSDDPQLRLPHPFAAQRAFVLVPWLDADADAQLPEGPVARLLDDLDVDEVRGVRPRPELDLLVGAP
ncbi:2-amino-4-hydroxy-6-hydroxymethyldihydropteridinediphosphokinase [Jatrophihabitans sp. GAS493]|uniref:2-amino-4-hydroxy-6- hydroxymethyldihydropteridine diphosphokinase n=1 Tax=Jatrophihabitans sp. GAS493 TaxID=1907575 RepID=UPI000BB8BBB1|nr:2-amino-4-hydroxy-6-hydroxymethyldihydropteridine diphosphokinase [Jatrophihabitans sp. GAS493]SOD70564.1 2-amino-4-hydroxy-6-hydroxymethyldihydropteridinediphosphokinase [Jatrophihabitans sp. GAS493]